MVSWGLMVVDMCIVVITQVSGVVWIIGAHSLCTLLVYKRSSNHCIFSLDKILRAGLNIGVCMWCLYEHTNDIGYLT